MTLLRDAVWILDVAHVRSDFDGLSALSLTLLLGDALKLAEFYCLHEINQRNVE